MADYMFLLESRLSPEQRAAMLRVQELAAVMGFNVYLTGGTVRDLITAANLRDLDLTVEGNHSKMARELEKGGAKVLSEDEKFRNVELLFAGDVEGSISAARDEHYVRPGTRPRTTLAPHHGGPAPPRLFLERHRHLPESRVPRSASRPDQRPLRHRTRRSPRAFNSQLHQSTRATLARTTSCGSHGVQARIAHPGVVQSRHRARTSAHHHSRRRRRRSAQPEPRRAPAIDPQGMGRRRSARTCSSDPGQETSRLRRHQPPYQGPRRSLHGRIPPAARHTDAAGHPQPP